VAKVTIKNPNAWADKVVALLQREIRNKSRLRLIAEFILERVYQNTKRGYYAGSNKNLAKLKPLSQNYIEYRKSLLGAETESASGFSRKSKKKRALKKFGDFFSPSKSNLTLTGQLLDALVSKVEGNQAIVEVSNSQRSDVQPGDLSTNAEVARKVIEDGRPFMRLDIVGQNRIRTEIIRQLRRALRRR
jgi:phage gpG-like protein